MTGIIFDTAAKAGLSQHFHIKVGTFGNPLCLQKLVLTLEISDPFLQLSLNILAGTVDLFLWNNIVGRREDGNMLELRHHLAKQRIHFADTVNLISEKLDPDQIISALCRIDLDRVASYTEAAAVQIHIIAQVLDRNQLMNDLITVLLHAGTQ